MTGDQRRSGPPSVGLRIRHSASAEDVQDPKMTEAERAELVELLLESERELMQALEGVNGRQWSFKREPDKWSIGEVVEHIVLADGLLFDTATKSLTGQPDAQWLAMLSKTETLRRALPDSIVPGRCAGVDSTAAREAARGAAVTLHRSACARVEVRTRDRGAAQSTHGSESVFRQPQRASVAAVHPATPPAAQPADCRSEGVRGLPAVLMSWHGAELVGGMVQDESALSCSWP